MKAIFDNLSAECSKLTTLRYSTSFSLGIYFLNKKLRQPIYAIYGFVRLADEIVDSFHDYDKDFLLKKFKNDCYEAIEQGISLNPILNSFQQVVNEYEIDRELIDLFLQSMEMDLNYQTYSSDKYDEYILGSAQVVGLMCLRVFTDKNTQDYEKLKDSAMMLGSAFQKVNFLRDINADYNLLNRTYFPNVNLSQFNNVEKKQIEEDIEREFKAALQGIKLLPKSAKSGVYLAYIYYLELFKKIKRTSAEKVMNKRIRISNGHKFGLMCDSLIRYKINVL
ncbi:phytoene/squalene synthase family protein [Pedobacter frigiditerrae]|uniref:Phytoene/squalene synthase family protein n=1 Tax=Pedobacter frigiditerrae TaxID=2530452 RepID=A0A4R0MQJ8_9SPHI|nr:phytoene/squalene synthase family protein [Pedobacter frigiditerrae]TCC89169.1 phytoene/squalene synthase family protein [Pedobacter frigiditerrae]